MGAAPDTDVRKAPTRNRRAPGPTGLPLLGSIVDLQRQGQVSFYLENWLKYGDVVRFQLGPYVVHVLAHPDHVHHVLAGNSRNYRKGPSYAKMQTVMGAGLLTSEGELWRRHRRVMQPTFTHRSVERFGSEMSGAVHAMLVGWQEAAESGNSLIINREMGRLALAIAGRTIFSSDLGDVLQSILEATADLGVVLNRRLGSIFDLPLFVPTPENRQFKQALQGFDAAVYELVQTRRQQNREGSDLLGALLSARDEESGEAMSDRQIRDEVITILLAGHETTALALTWTWYLLSQHPEVEERLHAELAAVLAGRAPTVEDLSALVYTRMVIEEAMRLYPPVWTFARAAIADDEIGGYHIPAGSLIFPCQLLTHRHPDFWERPELFDPERFSPERSKDRSRHAYFPFGGGPRSCIGYHYAMVELVLVLAGVAQRVRLRLLPGPPIEPVSRVTLHPSRDVQMSISLR